MDEASGGSSIGEAVSGRGDGAVGEDDIYYIPERRPSLDLGTNPLDLHHWVDEGRRVVGLAQPPAQSYGSLRSDLESDSMDHTDQSETRVRLDRTDSFSSACSWDSDGCNRKVYNRARDKDKDNDDTEQFDTEEIIVDPTVEENPSLTVEFTLKAICDTLMKLSSGDLETFKAKLQRSYPQSFSAAENQDLLDLVDRLLDLGLALSLRITLTLLEKMELGVAANHLQTLCIRNEVHYELCETLKTKYGNVCQDSALGEKTKPFDDVFTNLCITTMCNNGPNIEHEVMTVQKLDSNRGTGKLLSTKDILSEERLNKSYAKLAVVIGVAGSGKSMLVRKLILDWVERRSHQHVAFLFPLPFRELKQFEGSEVSLLQIVQTFYPAARKLRDEDFRSPDCRMMFVCDGLDEYDRMLDFQNTKLLADYTEAASLDTIVVNLLRDRLLYRGLFVVTSRPQVQRYVPWDLVYDEVELRGFGESDKDEYFKRRFLDAEQAARVLEGVGSMRTLRIMCHLPLFCSLVADECERAFSRDGPCAPPPRGLTGIYTKLLLVLMYRRQPRANADFLLSLGKLAFAMLEQNIFQISRSDWKEVGVDEAEAVIGSGLCTEYTTKPFVLYEEKVLSFIHPTVQEYLAALYVFLSFRNNGKDVFEPQAVSRSWGLARGHKVLEMYRNAMVASLQYRDGRFDILLRFLFGMASRSNQELLQTLCSSFSSPFSSDDKWSTLSKEAALLIRKMISDNRNPCRSSNLQRCLEELGHDSASEATSS